MKHLWSDWMKSLVVPVVIMGLGMLAGPASVAWGHGAEEDKVPLWQWEPEQFQQHVATVRSGKDLTPKSWPDGARVAVSFSFDFDTEPVWMGFQGQQSPSYMSRGEYGARAGMPRIFALLEKHDIPPRFLFLPSQWSCIRRSLRKSKNTPTTKSAFTPMCMKTR